MIEANSINITKPMQQIVRNVDHKLLYTPVGLGILRVCTHWCTPDRSTAWWGHSSWYCTLVWIGCSIFHCVSVCDATKV